MREKNYTIFIVDIDLNHATKIKEHLSSHKHYTFHLFSTIQDCKKNLHLNPVLIFLDHELTADKTHYKETLQELKTAAPKAEIVLFTGAESIAIIKDAMHYEAYNYYIKDNNAHLKAEYLIVQILHKHQLKEKIAQQKDLIKLLLFIVTALICMALAMYFTGFINDAYIGGSMFD